MSEAACAPSRSASSIRIASTFALRSAASAAWLIFRGLSFHVSHAWMLVKQAKPGLLNTTPDGDVDPFRHGWTRTITTGFGYKF